jgi:hypothetical protein
MIVAVIDRCQIQGPFGRASAVAKTAVAVATLLKWLLR